MGANNVWSGVHGRLIGIAVLLVVATGSVAIWMVERAQGGPIESFSDALWWALTTVTTVGYGEMYPTAPEGRGLGAFLIVGVGHASIVPLGSVPVS